MNKNMTANEDNLLLLFNEYKTFDMDQYVDFCV